MSSIIVSLSAIFPKILLFNAQCSMLPSSEIRDANENKVSFITLFMLIKQVRNTTNRSLYRYNYFIKSFPNKTAYEKKELPV